MARVFIFLFFPLYQKVFTTDLQKASVLCLSFVCGLPESTLVSASSVSICCQLVEQYSELASSLVGQSMVIHRLYVNRRINVFIIQRHSEIVLNSFTCTCAYRYSESACIGYLLCNAVHRDIPSTCVVLQSETTMSKEREQQSPNHPIAHTTIHRGFCEAFRGKASVQQQATLDTDLLFCSTSALNSPAAPFSLYLCLCIRDIFSTHSDTIRGVSCRRVCMYYMHCISYHCTGI